MVWPFGWVCHAVRAPGVKWTLAACSRDGPVGVATVSRYTVPVNHSVGPAAVTVEFLVICMSFSRVESPRVPALPVGSGNRELIELRGEYEVVTRQAGGGVGRELKRRPPPAQLDVGVVALRLGDERRLRDEPERVAEVRERELAAKGTVSVPLPARDVGRERRGFFLRK